MMYGSGGLNTGSAPVPVMKSIADKVVEYSQEVATLATEVLQLSNSKLAGVMFNTAECKPEECPQESYPHLFDELRCQLNTIERRLLDIRSNLQNTGL